MDKKKEKRRLVENWRRKKREEKKNGGSNNSKSKAGNSKSQRGDQSHDQLSGGRRRQWVEAELGARQPESGAWQAESRSPLWLVHVLVLAACVSGAGAGRAGPRWRMWVALDVRRWEDELGAHRWAVLTAHMWAVLTPRRWAAQAAVATRESYFCKKSNVLCWR